MTLETEKGETSGNILTICPIQNVHCVKGLLMRNTLWPHSRIKEFLSEKPVHDIHRVLKRSSYVYPQLWVSMTFKRSQNWTNRDTLPPDLPLAISFLIQTELPSQKFLFRIWCPGGHLGI